MLTTALIIFIVFAIIVSGLACWYFSFRDMYLEAMRYSFYCSSKKEALAIFWGNRIQKRLERCLHELPRFLLGVFTEEIALNFNIGAMINKINTFFILSDCYDIVEKRRFEKIKKIIVSRVDKIIRESFPAIPREALVYPVSEFYKNVTIPAIKEILSEMKFIEELEKIAKYSILDDCKKLIRERQIEILKDDEDRSVGYFFEILKMLLRLNLKGSTVWDYWKSEFAEFMSGEFSEEGKNELLCLTEKNKLESRLSEIAEMIFGKFVPKFSKEELGCWIPYFFYDHSSFTGDGIMRLFIERMIDVYANCTWKELIEPYEKYKDTQFREVFERLLEDAVKPFIENDIQSLQEAPKIITEPFEKLPVSSRAFCQVSVKFQEFVKETDMDVLRVVPK